MTLEYKDFHDYGLPYAKTANADDIMKNIEYLYQKMKQCTRKVTYFDLYKINTIITQDSEFDAKINALEPYSTAVINTKITTANDTYSPGDMVVKNTDGTTTTIFAQRGGIFYPQSLVKKSDDKNNYTYDFSFAFQSTSPDINSSPVSVVPEQKDEGLVWTAEYASTINFTGLKSGVPASPYNAVYINPTVTNGMIVLNTPIAKDAKQEAIYPIVHAYVDNEEVYMDQMIASGSDQFTIKLIGTLCTKVVIK